MELLKRYSISFGIAGLLLYYFTIMVEKHHERNMPHNLTNKTEEIVQIILPEKRYFEKCLDLSDSQELQFGFDSQSSLSFNLHYHQKGEIIYEFNENSIDKLENTFQPEKRGYFCLQWGNSRKEKIEINYHFKIVKRSSGNN